MLSALMSCERVPRTAKGCIFFFAFLFVVEGCAIDPLRVSPTASLANGSKCTSSALRDGSAAHGLLAAEVFDVSLESRKAFSAIQAHVTTVSSKLSSKPGVPEELQTDNVVLNLRKLVVYQHFSALATLVDAANRSGDLVLTETDRASLLSSIISARNNAKPASLSRNDFKNFLKKSVELKSSDAASRTLRYESYYFNGTFVDRFGNKLSKPSLSLTITDQEINGAVNALIEAIADDLFPDTPVWVDSATKPTKYYPGATANEPSVAVYEKEVAGSSNFVALDVPSNSQPACGMTELKSEVLAYLAGKAGTWASGESGIIVGAFGGTNVGIPVILGKISIGDNKVVTSIVQTVLSTAAKRAAFQATIPVLDREGPYSE